MTSISPPQKRPRLAASAIALAAAGLVAASLSGCHSADSKAAAPKADAGAVVSVATVLERKVTETQVFSGRIEALERVVVRPRVGGYITAVHVQPGALVRKGDLLFVIDRSPYEAELKRAEAAAAAATARVELARLELTRSEKLFADKAIPQRELDANASSFKELGASARAAQAQYDNARLNLNYTRVISPIDGRVGKAEITLGNLVDPTTVLTSVVSDQRMYASFDGDEATFLQVGAVARKGGQVKVRIGLANEQGFPHQGKLEFVDNQLDAQTGAVRMRALFDNTDKALAPGLFARVQVEGASNSDAGTGKTLAPSGQAVLINDRAVGTDQNRKFVYVVGPRQEAVYRNVTLGPVIDGLRVVRGGLTAGETIVVNGLQRVHPGGALAPHVVAMDFDPGAELAEGKGAAATAGAAAASAGTAAGTAASAQKSAAAPGEVPADKSASAAKSAEAATAAALAAASPAKG